MKKKILDGQTKKEYKIDAQTGAVWSRKLIL